jgi:hypothetical protein
MHEEGGSFFLKKAARNFCDLAAACPGQAEAQ